MVAVRTHTLLSACRRFSRLLHAFKVLRAEALSIGVEDLSAYKGCSLEFGDIENIHVVRSNLGKLFKLIRKCIAKSGATLPADIHTLYAQTGWYVLPISCLLTKSLTGGVSFPHCKGHSSCVQSCGKRNG